MTTLNGIYHSTYNLKSTKNPFILGAQAYFDVPSGVAIFGATGVAWNVTNDGKIAGEVDLAGGGSFTNASTGTLTGELYLGAKSGGGSGTVTNSGNIYGEVRLENGGAATNSAGAKIVASGAGVSGIELDATGNVVNQGTVKATNGHYDSGIRLMAGGTVNNSGYVLATGQHVAAVGLYAGGSATNTGTIRAIGHALSGVFLYKGGSFTNSGIVIASNNLAVYAFDGGTISNAKSGIIIGSTGVTVNTVYASVYNAGAIEGAGYDVNGVWLGAGGKITNSATGLITAVGGHLNGVGLDATGTVTNAGKISVTAEYGAGIALYKGGTISNSGSIAADGANVAGVYLESGGTLNNSGSIVATGIAGYTSGIFSLLGGTITNSATGVISGANGIYVSGAVAAVTNSGKISGGEGVYLAAGGTIVNNAKASIVATSTGGPNQPGYGAAVFVSGGITNYGSIASATFGAGVSDACVITNKKGGVISGTLVGAIIEHRGQTSNSIVNVNNAGAITGDTGVAGGGTGVSIVQTIVNSGTITGTTVTSLSAFGRTFNLGDGVGLFAGGAVTNQTGGTIAGARYGVYMSGGAGTVTNAGAITGKKGSIDFTGAGANSLTLQTGSQLTGAALGSTAAGATNNLTLQGSGTAANVFDNFNTLTVSAGANWTLTANSSFGSATIDGELTVKGGLGGPVTVTGGGVAVFDSAVTGGLTFNGTGELELGAAYTGAISGFGANDVFDLLAFKKSTTTFGFAENGANTAATLTFTQAGTAAETLALSGAYAKADFSLVAGANNVGLLVKFV